MRLLGDTHIDPIFGIYKGEEFLRVLDRWMPKISVRNFLKTDLREEAYGQDQVLFSLPANKFSVFGIDIDPSTVERCRWNSQTRARRYQFMVSDVRWTPFEDGFFDVIFSSSTLDHFQDDGDLSRSLSELKRIAAPGAVIIIAMNNSSNLFFRLSVFVGRWLGWIKEPTRFYSINQLSKFCRDAGLAIEEIDAAVVAISPVNRALLWLRTFLKAETVDFFSEKIVLFFKKIGQNKRIRMFLGWFIVLKCRAI